MLRSRCTGATGPRRRWRCGLDLSRGGAPRRPRSGRLPLQVVCEDVSGLNAPERPGEGDERPDLAAVLFAGRLELVDFEEIADEPIVEIEEGPGS